MLLAECSSDGTARIYGYLPGTSTPLFLKQNGEYYWYRTDRLGIPQKLVESNGTVVWSGAYDAFGNCEVGVETVENNLRLPGQYYDRETGLYYNLNRYYDPKTGRYLQPDPAGDGLNPYIYVGGNPVNTIDPEGLCALRIVGGFSEMVAGATMIPGTGWLGTGAGLAVIANGFDNLVAGARSLISGVYKMAGLESVIHWAIPNETLASLVYMGTQIAIPAGAKVYTRFDRARRLRDFAITPYRQVIFEEITKHGSTTPEGEIWLAHWLEGEELYRALKHESIHKMLTFGSKRFGLKLAKLYHRSTVWRFTEEVMAEAYASGGVVEGLFHGTNYVYHEGARRTILSLLNPLKKWRKPYPSLNKIWGR